MANIDALDMTKTAVNQSLDSLWVLRLYYQEQLATISSQFEILENQRASIEDAIQKHRQVLSPVRRLPIEILAKIFHHCVEYPAHAKPDALDGGKYTFDTASDSTLWVIERVCRQWRAAVIGDNTLWSFINIFITDKNFDEEDGGGRYLSKLARQVSRAQRSSLSVCICRVAERTVLPPEVSIFLLPISHRIHEMFLYLPPSMITGLSRLRYHLASLVLLDISNAIVHSDPEDEIIDVRTVKVFDQCPFLTTLRYNDIEFPDSQFAIPWDGLQRFSCLVGVQKAYTGPKPHQLRSVLSRSSNLEEAFVLTELPNPSRTLVKPVVCANLTQLVILHVHANNSLALLEMFAQLSVPSLRTLEVHHADPRAVLNAKVFTAMVSTLEQSQSPLAALHYPRGDVLPEDIIRLLRTTPTLESLTIRAIERAPGFTNAILEELAFKFSESGTSKAGSSGVKPIVAPRLHTLRLGGCLKFEGDVFADMVHSRWALRPFKRIALVWVTPEPREMERAQLELAVIWGRVKALRSEGLRFEADVTQSGWQWGAAASKSDGLRRSSTR